MKKLSTTEIEARLSDFPNWEYSDDALHTTLEFGNFKDAFSVMTRIAFEAEKQNHHPDWSNVYNTLSISLSTHEVGGLTEKDFAMAKVIDELIE